MKICLLNHDLQKNTGAGRFGLNLIGALKRNKSEWQYNILTHEDGLPTNPLFSGKIENKLKDYDIIHALDSWPYGVMAVRIGRRLKKKVVITAVGTGAVEPLYQPVKKQLLAWAYRRADALTAISNNTKREILKVVPGLDIQVINHGVNYNKYQVVSIKYQVEIKNLKPYILSVGALKPRKGYKYSIEAFAKVAKEFPNLKYVVVGQGSEREALKLQITNYKLQSKVIFLDRVVEEELISLYQNAELFVLLPVDDNHDIEGFGLVFLEAAALGLPVIGSAGTAAEDAVLDGENGFLVDPKNLKETAEKIVKILASKELKERFSQKSVQFAKSMSWARVAKEYISVYERIQR